MPITEEIRFWLEQPQTKGRGRLPLNEEVDIASGQAPLIFYGDEGVPDDVLLKELEEEAAHDDPLAKYILEEVAKASRLAERRAAVAADPLAGLNTDDPVVDCFVTVSRDRKFHPAFDDLTNKAYNPNIGKALINHEPDAQPLPVGRLAQRNQRLAEAEARAVRTVTVTELAALLGVNRSTVVSAIERGELLAIRSSARGMFKINRKDVPSYLTRCGYSDTSIQEILTGIDALFGSQDIA